MSKLPASSLGLLKWLAKGNAVEVCTSVGRCLANLATCGTGAPHKTKSSIYKLIAYGLVQERESLYYGVRWSRFTINDKGLSVLAELEVQHA